jgi:hypothetical protein
VWFARRSRDIALLQSRVTDDATSTRARKTVQQQHGGALTGFDVGIAKSDLGVVTRSSYVHLKHQRSQTASPESFEAESQRTDHFRSAAARLPVVEACSNVSPPSAAARHYHNACASRRALAQAQ